MQLQSTILLLASLLAVTNASPTNTNHPTKPDKQFCPIDKAQARIRTWNKREGCPSASNASDLKDSPTTTVPQNQCFDAPQFLSYKIWQPLRTTPLAVCTFSVFPEPGCTGEAVEPVNPPATEHEAQCASAVVAVGEGSRSFRFKCECLGPLCEEYLRNHKGKGGGH